MARIRSRGNRDTELALAKLLRAHGITGWRRQRKIRVTCGEWRVTSKSPKPRSSPFTHHSSLTVTPDFVFLKQRVTVFVDGCFWHGCPRHATQPKNNAAFWRRKLAGNRARDRRVNRALRRAGWRVVRIWEHALRRATKGTRRGVQNAARGTPAVVRRMRRTLGAEQPAAAPFS